MTVERQFDLRVVTQIHPVGFVPEVPALAARYLRSTTKPLQGYPDREITNHFFDPTQSAIPDNAITYNGIPLTYQGLFITYTE